MKKKMFRKKRVYPEMSIHPNIYSLLRCSTQEATAEYVKKVLSENSIPFKTDYYGNIFSFEHDNVPLLSAHMDTVMGIDDQKEAINIIPDKSGIIKNGSIIGGDDKCGVYIILKMLLAKKKVNFIFSKDEEIGCIGIEEFAESNFYGVEIKNKNLFCLVLDRKGDSDIVCANNDYGTKEFEKALVNISNNHGLGFKPATGTFSDADTISDYISTANISVGYFNPHTKSEIIVVNSLEKSAQFVDIIIDELKEKFKAPKKVRNFYNKSKGWAKMEYDEFDEYEDYTNGYFTEKVKCDSCSVLSEEDGWDFVNIYLNTGEQLQLCVDCAFSLQDQLRRELSRFS